MSVYYTFISLADGVETTFQGTKTERHEERQTDASDIEEKERLLKEKSEKNEDKK